MAQIEVPEGCALTLLPEGEADGGAAEVNVRAECACGDWSYVLYDVPASSAEMQGRVAWMRHLAGDE